MQLPIFRRWLIGVHLCCAFVVSSAAAETNWPQFRGPDARGVSQATGLPESWSTAEGVLWQTDIRGHGWSSPIVWGDKVFVTSAVAVGEVEAPKKGLYRGGDRLVPSPHEHQWVVYCIDVNSGEMAWEKVAHSGRPEGARHIKNTYATETPVTDGERLYAYFGNVGLFVYDLKGKPLWEKKWKPVKVRQGWGTAASPVLHGDVLYIVNDNEDQSYLVALDKKSGRQLWRVDRDERSNWSTPYVWRNKVRTELITSGTGLTRSYSLNGDVLWSFKGASSITIPTPFATPDLLYVSSGFVLDDHRPIYAIRPGGTGDLSLPKGKMGSRYVAWYQPKAAPYNPTPLLYGDYLYVLLDRGFFSCHDAQTGQEIYKERIAKDIGGFGGFTSSPWAYEDKVFCLNEDGQTFVLKAGPKYKLLRVNSLGEMCMATPAIARGSLFVRTLTKLYRIGRLGK